MEQAVSFQFSFAGVTLSVRCLFETTKACCRDFLVDDGVPADEQIVLTMADIDAERALLMSKKKRDEQLEASSPEALEVLALCRRAAQLLPRYGVVLFHGSALALDGEGVLFTATSGTGKSTHSSLWRSVYGDRVTMVNDDKPFLRISPEGVWVCGSPWTGKHRLGSNTCVPLKAVCILCRGEENRAERISPREAMPMLLQQMFHPEGDAEVLRKLQLADQLSRKAECYRLHCNMDPDAARVVYTALGFREKEKEL